MGESNSTEVIRVVKYDKNWNRLGQASLNGANTVIPFDGGSLRCDEYSGYLYIRTCHKMYKSNDGLNHQSNLTMAVRQSDMSVTDSYYDVMNSSYGYISHSFNQFIIVDQDGKLVTLDHGDAYPRGVVFCKYYADAGSGMFTGQGYGQWCSCGNMIDFAGAVGDNTTGGSVGGLEETSDCYIMTYNYDGQGGTGDRYPYCHWMDKASGKSWSAKLTQTPGATTPVLASTGLNGGYMLWNGKSGRTVSDTLYYIQYGADGQPGQVQPAAGSLSDCQPIAYNGKVVWYVTDNSAPTFYQLDSSGVTKVPGAGDVQTTYTVTFTGGAGAAGTVWSHVDPKTGAWEQDSYFVMSGVKQIASNLYDCNMALKEDGSLWTWGKNNSEIWLGREYPSESWSAPAKILDNVAYATELMALKKDGTVWSWGSNYFGAVGNGSTSDVSTPIKIMDNAAAIWASCSRHGQVEKYVLTKDGDLYSWGFNGEGQLGYKDGNQIRKVNQGIPGADMEIYYQNVPLKTDLKGGCKG